MIVISQDVSLALLTQGGADYPVVGYHNLVQLGSIAADSEQTDFPASNLANPSTTALQGWRSDSTADQYVTATISPQVEVDYVGIARHNLGSSQTVVTVEAILADEGADWEVVVEPTTLGDDAPAVFRFAPDFYVGVRLKLEPVATAPRIAVMYVGTLLVFQYGVQAGHTPIPYGRSRRVVTGRSQGGDYLGRIVVGGKLRSEVTIRHLDPAWYREFGEPFARDGALLPFFWAWKPQTYPREVGFAWLPEGTEIIPVASHLAGYTDITFQMEGIIS